MHSRSKIDINIQKLITFLRTIQKLLKQKPLQLVKLQG